MKGEVLAVKDCFDSIDEFRIAWFFCLLRHRERLLRGSLRTECPGQRLRKDHREILVSVFLYSSNVSARSLGS